MLPFPTTDGDQDTHAAVSTVDEVLGAMEGDLISLRRALHRDPYISWQEAPTLKKVTEVLEAAGLTVQPLAAGGGIVEIGSDAPRVGLRADMDALPVAETTGLTFASRNPGVTHACGHDIHTTALVGACLALAELDRRGQLPVGVRAIFQPAEEVQPSGARTLMGAGVLEGLRLIYALHCEPKLDVGTIGSRVGPITAASDALHVTVTGPGGHTSRPHLTADIVYALGQIITQVPGVLGRRVDPRAGLNLTWGAVHAGQAHNAIPDVGTLTGTLRCMDVNAWRSAASLAVDTIHEVARPYAVQVEVQHVPGLPPVMNDEEALGYALAAARDLLGEEHVVPVEQSLGGEDFAWFLTEVPGALLRLGTRTPGGITYDLHRGDIIFDERAIGIGARVFVLTALRAGATL